MNEGLSDHIWQQLSTYSSLSSTFFNAKSSFGMCGQIPQCEDLRVAGSPVVTLADFEGNVDWSNAVTLEG